LSIQVLLQRNLIFIAAKYFPRFRRFSLIAELLCFVLSNQVSLTINGHDKRSRSVSLASVLSQQGLASPEPDFYSRQIFPADFRDSLRKLNCSALSHPISYSRPHGHAERSLSITALLVHAVSQLANQYLTCKAFHTKVFYFCPSRVSFQLTLCYHAKRKASSHPTVMLSGVEASHTPDFCPSSVTLQLTLCYDAKRNALPYPTIMLTNVSISHARLCNCFFPL
jgi:hypothetical protein